MIPQPWKLRSLGSPPLIAMPRGPHTTLPYTVLLCLLEHTS